MLLFSVFHTMVLNQVSAAIRENIQRGINRQMQIQVFDDADVGGRAVKGQVTPSKL